MQLTICRNLHTNVDGATFDVHAAGCRDANNRRRYVLNENYTDEYASQAEVAEDVYSDQIYSDNAGDPVWGRPEAYIPDFHFHNCTHGLPESLPESTHTPKGTNMNTNTNLPTIDDTEYFELDYVEVFEAPDGRYGVAAYMRYRPTNSKRRHPRPIAVEIHEPNMTLAKAVAFAEELIEDYEPLVEDDPMVVDTDGNLVAVQ